MLPSRGKMGNCRRWCLAWEEGGGRRGAEGGGEGGPSRPSPPGEDGPSMKLPRHLALEELREISSTPLLPGFHAAMSYFLAPCSPGKSRKPRSSKKRNYVLGTHYTSPPLRLTAAATWIVCSTLRMRTSAQAGRGNHSWRATDTQTST